MQDALARGVEALLIRGRCVGRIAAANSRRGQPVGDPFVGQLSLELGQDVGPRLRCQQGSRKIERFGWAGSTKSRAHST
jgi:hypothetical protein